MKRRDAVKGILLFSLGTGVLNSCTDKYQAIKDLKLDHLIPTNDELDLVDIISKIVVPLQSIPALADHTALPFILKMVDDIYPKEERDIFLSGYQNFDKKYQELNGKKFSKISLEEQTEVLRSFNDKTEGLDTGMQKFFDIIKGESLKYLTTSEYVQRKVNYYEMAPGRHKGDVLLSELQNANKI